MCTKDDCASNQILILDGTCRDCENWTRPNSQGRTCVSDIDNCSNLQYVDQYGVCYKCPALHRPSDDKHSCIQDDCDYGIEIIL